MFFQLKIITKLKFFVFILLILFLFSLFSVIFLNKSRANISYYVNLAGRNRMISQRLAFLSEQELINKEEIDNLVNLHTKSLQELRKSEVQNELLFNSEKLIFNINNADSIWNQFRISVIQLSDPSISAEQKKLLKNNIRSQAQPLLNANDAIVTDYVLFDEKMVLYFNYFIIFVCVTWPVFIGLFILEIKYIIKKLNFLAQYAQGVNINNFEIGLPIVGNDEFSFLAKAFNHLNDKVKNSFVLIEQRLQQKTFSIKETLKQVEDKNIQLEKTKKAMLSLLEDLEAEQSKLKQREAELSDAQKIGKFGSFVWNLSNNKVHWSDESFYIHGLKPTKDNVPPPLEVYYRIIHPDDLLAAKESIQKASSSTKESEYTYQVIWSDKSVHWVKVVSKLVKDKNDIASLRGTFQDVTREKIIDKAKTEFVSLASHQLRTPLTAINWYTEMLINGDAGTVSAEQLTYLREVASSSKRMVELVAALLNVSRIELGTFAVEPRPTDLIVLLSKILQELSYLSDSKGITIVNKHEVLPQVNVDPNLMTIIYQNLLTNAIKYTPNGGTITINHTIDNLRQKESYICFQITDTGIGIPVAEQDLIFKKLYRANNAQKMDAQGTGLGLYIVKAIIDQANGSISFDSKEGKGTTFKVTIPLSGMIKNDGSKPLEMTV